MEQERKVYKVWAGKPEGKRPLEIPWRRWKDEIVVDLRKISRGVWSGFVLIRIGTGGGSCGQGDEPSSSETIELVIFKLTKLETHFFWNLLP
jgi:hypothetical protein